MAIGQTLCWKTYELLPGSFFPTHADLSKQVWARQSSVPFRAASELWFMGLDSTSIDIDILSVDEYLYDGG